MGTSFTWEVSSDGLTSCPGDGPSHLSAKCHRIRRLALTLWLEKTTFVTTVTVKATMVNVQSPLLIVYRFLSKLLLTILCTECSFLSLMYEEQWAGASRDVPAEWRSAGSILVPSRDAGKTSARSTQVFHYWGTNHGYLQCSYTQVSRKLTFEIKKEVFKLVFNCRKQGPKAQIFLPGNF